MPGVHTHELWLDADGTLYGEHLWYEGEATDRWGHRVWKRTPDGRLSDVIPARRGFRDDYRDFFFARDARGAMYWIERAAPATVCMRLPDAPIRRLAVVKLEDAGWVSASPDGLVFIAANGGIVRVSPDGATRELPRVTMSRDRHAMMGVATDPQVHVYAAAHIDRRLRRIAPRGEVTTVVTSPWMWGPTAAAIGADGAIWVLESSTINAQRVRRVGRDGGSRV